jgi:hypothetical protein
MSGKHVSSCVKTTVAAYEDALAVSSTGQCLWIGHTAWLANICEGR